MTIIIIPVRCGKCDQIIGEFDIAKSGMYAVRGHECKKEGWGQQQHIIMPSTFVKVVDDDEEE